MAPLQEIDSHSPSIWMVSPWSWSWLILAVLATIVILSSLIWASIWMCACCAGGRRRKRDIQELEMDAAVLPPPEPVSQSVRDLTLPRDAIILPEPSYMPVPAPSKKRVGKKSAKKEPSAIAPLPTEKHVSVKVLPKTVKQEAATTYVPPEKLNQYITLCPADSAVFNKPGFKADLESKSKATLPHYRTFALADDPSVKYVSKEALGHYRTLAFADSMVFDQNANKDKKKQVCDAKSAITDPKSTVTDATSAITDAKSAVSAR